MSLKGKIALIIVVPIYTGIILIAFLIAVSVYTIGLVLNYSGIGEAFEYIGKRIRTEGVKNYFRKIRKKEGLL